MAWALATRDPSRDKAYPTANKAMAPGRVTQLNKKSSSATRLVRDEIWEGARSKAGNRGNSRTPPEQITRHRSVLCVCVMCFIGAGMSRPECFFIKTLVQLEQNTPRVVGARLAKVSNPEIMGGHNQ